MNWPSTFQKATGFGSLSFEVAWTPQNFDTVILRCRSYCQNESGARHATLSLVDGRELMVDCAHVLYYMLYAMYLQQSRDEQQSQDTIHDDGIGFSRFDANFLSSVAKKSYPHGVMTPAQVFHVAKSLKKYRRQILALAVPIKTPAKQLELNLEKIPTKDKTYSV
jgi:hypothetical protein